MPYRTASVELVPVTAHEPFVVHVFVTVDGERMRVRVPRVVAGVAREDDGRTTEHAVRAELFDRRARGLVLVVTHASRERGKDRPSTLERSIWASRDGRTWALADVDESGGMPVAYAQVGFAFAS